MRFDYHRRFAAWTRRHRRPILVVLILAVFHLPVIPFRPYCWVGDRETYGQRLSEAYFEVFAGGDGIEHEWIFTIGTRVFITFGYWLDDDKWRLNRMNKSVRNVADPERHYLTPKPVPPHIAELYRAYRYHDSDIHTGSEDDKWCALMKAVVTPE